MLIYGIFNKINGKVYVGQTVNTLPRRWNQHRGYLVKNKHPNIYLQRSWNKHKEKNFEIQILHDNIQTKDELNILEETYRLKYAPNVFNLKSGGLAKSVYSDISLKKMSKSMKKVWSDPEYKKRVTQKIRESRKVESCIKLISENQTRLWADDEYKKKFSNKMKSHWDDPKYRKKMKQVQNSPEYSKKMSNIYKDKWKYPEYRAKFEKYYGHVIDPEGNVYEITGIEKFCREHNLDGSNLARVCNGKYKSCKGWRKYEPIAS